MSFHGLDDSLPQNTFYLLLCYMQNAKVREPTIEIDKYASYNLKWGHIMKVDYDLLTINIHVGRTTFCLNERYLR